MKAHRRSDVVFVAFLFWLIIERNIIMNRNSTKQLIICALCIGLGLVLPSFFHMFGGTGAVMLPMHIPVLICGFICGWPYGIACGAILPLLSSVLTGMPPIFPIGLAMMFELATYGAVAGLLFKKLDVYPSLVGAMLTGRVISGVANTILLGMAGRNYSLQVFLTASFITALPGIIVQLVVIPLLMIALVKAGLIPDHQKAAAKA